jgi:hypothetical protein
MHGKHWLPACTHKPRACDAPRKRVQSSATICTYSLPWKNLTGVFAPRADRADVATIWFEAFDFDFKLGAHTQTSRLEQLTRLKVCMRNVALADVDLSQPPGLVMTWLAQPGPCLPLYVPLQLASLKSHQHVAGGLA